MHETIKREHRPPECGACYARLHSKDPYQQYLLATNFSPGLRKFAGGTMIAQQRIGKNGEPFDLYKVRTMRDDIADHELAAATINNKDNPRVTPVGKLLRKYWIDELPQLVNLVKGDLKLVGVRALPLAIDPVFPKELRKLRLKVRPGLISIAYANPTETIKERLDVEKTYLQKYDQAPLRTDFIYFCKFLYQVLLKRKRSS